ncbi:conserved hypothetical protein [Virus Rctr71]|nr:conserved hypothetical protein [Virus Rctr71]
MGPANNLIDSLGKIFEHKRQVSPAATITRVQRDGEGRAIGAYAAIDGAEYPIGISYGQNISVGSRFEAENIGTVTAPQWRVYRAVAPLSPPSRLVAPWEEISVGGHQYYPGDLLAGDIISTDGANLYYKQSDNTLSLRKGDTATITLYGDTGSARFGEATNGKASLRFDAVTGELSLSRRVSGSDIDHFKVDSTGAYVNGRLTVTDVISNSLTDAWNQSGAKGFWLGKVGNYVRFRLGTFGTGNYLYWNEEDDKLFISGEFEGTLDSSVTIPATNVTVADSGAYYVATHAEGVFAEIGGWSIGSGTGISVSASGLLRSTPSVSINQAANLTWTGTHAFNGTLNVGTNLAFQGARSITTNSSNSLTVAPGGNILFNPTGNNLLPVTGYDLNIGSLQKKYLTLHAAELWVENLVAQNTIATIGGRILVGPTTTLTRDLGSAVGDTTIYVKHSQMTSGDRVYMEANGNVEFFAITSSATEITPNAEYSYTIIRNLDGSGRNAWYAGDAMFNTGQAGNGFIDLYSLRGVKSSSFTGPTIVGNVRNSSTYNDWTERWAIGNLAGLAFPSQPTNEYGFYAGDGRAVGDKYIRISTWGAELHNLPLNLYSSGTAVISVNPSHPSAGGPAVAVGANANSLTYNANTGIYAGWDSTLSAYVMKIGNDEQYLKWNGSELEVSGIIRVVDGGDFLPITYRPVQVNFTHLSVASSTTETITFARSGYLNTYDGHRYYFSTTIPNEIRITIDKGYRDVVAYVFKDGHNIHRVPYGGGEPLFCNGIDNALPNGELPPLIDVNFERTDRYFDNAYYSQADRNNHVIVATVRLSSDYLRVDGVFARGESPSTTIGPGYIVTDSLSAISANLGTVTAGSIEVGSTNKLWLNVNNDTLKLAIGPNATGRSNAPFRVYETGRTIIGDGTSYIEWNSPNLIVKGNIQADAGSINALSVTGQLSWNSGHSYINSSIIRVSDSGTTSLLRIGDATENYHGLINIDMAQGAGTGWAYGVRIADGGNTSTQVQGLYLGRSEISGDAAVDRIFLARTTTGSYSDGFYAEMGISGSGGFIAASLNSTSYWDSKGAGVKIDHSGTAPGMLINIKNSGSHQPAIWATAHQDSATAMLYALLTGPGQTGLEVNRVNNNGVAVKTNGAPIQMGWGDITGIGRMIFRSGGGITGTTNLGTPRFDAWIEVWIEGNSNNYYIPLTAFGTH